MEFCIICSIAGTDVEAWDENDGVGEPETTIAGKGCGAKRVSHSLKQRVSIKEVGEMMKERGTDEFPHPSGELDHATVEKGETDNNVGLWGYRRGSGQVQLWR